MEQAEAGGSTNLVPVQPTEKFCVQKTKQKILCKEGRERTTYKRSRGQDAASVSPLLVTRAPGTLLSCLPAHHICNLTCALHGVCRSKLGSSVVWRGPSSLCSH